jgi:hypothetical protein
MVCKAEGNPRILLWLGCTGRGGAEHFVLLTVWRAPPLVVVVISALGGIALAQAKS